MARKRVERNISFDDVRKVYYVSMDLGKNSEGKRVKQYRTFPNLTSARTGLREFYADRDKLLHPPKQEQTLRQWLDYWMENIIRPNRAETTVYAYQKIIDNHLDPLLGAVPLSKLSPKQIQEYYQTMTRTEGLSSNTIRRHHDLLSAALRMAVRQDMLRVNPMERVEPPRPKLHEASYYTQENLKVPAGRGPLAGDGGQGHRWAGSAAGGDLRPEMGERGLPAPRRPYQGGPHCLWRHSGPEGDKKPLLHAHPVYA